MNTKANGKNGNILKSFHAYQYARLGGVVGNVEGLGPGGAVHGHLLDVLDEEEAAALADAEDERVEERAGVRRGDGVHAALRQLDAQEVLHGAHRGE